MNINYRVVALDPGGTTGWAQYDAEYMPPLDGKGRGELIDWKLTVLHFGPHEHHGELYAMLETSHIHDFYLVTESFEYRNNMKHRDNINLMSKEYIGVAKLFRDERDLHRRFFEQKAAQAKPFVTDQKLRAMNWWTPGMKHANDAARHLAFFLINHEKRKDLVQSWRGLT